TRTCVNAQYPTANRESPGFRILAKKGGWYGKRSHFYDAIIQKFQAKPQVLFEGSEHLCHCNSASLHEDGA
ncbi:MAG TPA: hypothetical protein VFJ27_08620, partial [Terriglobia bacterium]|nr:hypothetical protein [Terriglobia bacterium]